MVVVLVEVRFHVIEVVVLAVEPWPDAAVVKAILTQSTYPLLLRRALRRNRK